MVARRLGREVEVDVPGAARVRELAVLDAHLAEHALDRVEAAGEDADARDVALGVVLGHRQRARRDAVRPARVGDVDRELAAPPAELDDERDAACRPARSVSVKVPSGAVYAVTSGLPAAVAPQTSQVMPAANGWSPGRSGRSGCRRARCRAGGSPAGSRTVPVASSSSPPAQSGICAQTPVQPHWPWLIGSPPQVCGACSSRTRWCCRSRRRPGRS